MNWDCSRFQFNKISTDAYSSRVTIQPPSAALGGER